MSFHKCMFELSISRSNQFFKIVIRKFILFCPRLLKAKRLNKNIKEFSAGLQEAKEWNKKTGVREGGGGMMVWRWRRERVSVADGSWSCCRAGVAGYPCPSILPCEGRWVEQTGKQEENLSGVPLCFRWIGDSTELFLPLVWGKGGQNTHAFAISTGAILVCLCVCVCCCCIITHAQETFTPACYSSSITIDLLRHAQRHLT